MDCQPLSLEDSWRLRVASAQAYSIVKNRDIKSFERVMGFLEDTYRLLPRLVPPIKHMKIVFGLKTMVWSWVVVQFFIFISLFFLKLIHFLPSVSLPVLLTFSSPSCGCWESAKDWSTQCLKSTSSFQANCLNTKASVWVSGAWFRCSAYFYIFEKSKKKCSYFFFNVCRSKL